MAQKLIWGSDLYKGFKLPKSNLMGGGAIDDLLPFQMLTLEQKTADWIKAVADYNETTGWNNVERRAGKIQQNFWMRNGDLNKSDYIINPSRAELHKAIHFLSPPETQSPLEMFYPLAPTFVEMLRGEFIKRDNSWTVEAIDPQSTSEAFKTKEDAFKEIIMEQAMLEKQQQMSAMGLGEEMDPEEYQRQMQQFQQRLQDVELKAKSFRTTGQQWAEKVVRIHDKRYNLKELEPDAFDCGLTTDREFWHIDLLDDDFRLELLNPKWVDYHKRPNEKYVSNGDYFLWFDWMSAGDIVNIFGRKMKEDDILKMKDIYFRTSNIAVVDSQRSFQGAYYDLSKNWTQATDLDPAMNNALLGKELAYNFMRSPNFDHNQDVDILNSVWGNRITGHPQMFRVMRLYWRSLRRIGWLTKINRDGTIIKPDWIDENYRVTVEPEYDKSVVKEETKDNLLYGEHIDWTWVPEWRHVIKISPNQKHTFWLNTNSKFESIYIGGEPVKFQFKGKDNPFDSLPPVEGCEFSYFNTTPHSLVSRLSTFQILYNIAMNKVPKKFMKDYGNKVAIDKRMLSVNNSSNDTTRTIDPLEDMHDRLANDDLFPYSINRDMLEGMPQPSLPSVLQLSTAQEAQYYLQMADQIKAMAGETIGITRQRLGASKASDTATAVQQGINYSETQTEKYFEQHSNLMERVRQRMLDATQYYSTFQESSREVYLNEKEETMFLEITGMENTFPHYNLYLTSRANTRDAINQIKQFLQQENTLDILPSKKVGALIEQNLPKMEQLIREGELEHMEKEKEQRDFEAQQEQQRLQAAQKLKETDLAFRASEAQKDRDKDIEVATIRALGGVQTDNNKNTKLDASENLEPFFRQQEINDARQATKDSNAAKRQTNIDKLMVDREKSAQDLEREKIKGEYALRVAKENKTNAELKKRQAKKKSK